MSLVDDDVYRLMVKGPNRIGIQPVPQHDIAVQTGFMPRPAARICRWRLPSA